MFLLSRSPKASVVLTFYSQKNKMSKLSSFLKF